MAQIDISKPEGVAEVRKLLKGVSAADALRVIEENELSAGARGFERGSAEVSNVDKEKRTVDLSFSSEEPVERYFGIEILSHDNGAPDLRWLQSGNAPMLWMHDGRSQIGVVESASHDLKNKRCVAKCRLANDDEGNKFLNRVADGIIKNVSFAYRISEWSRAVSDDENKPDVYTATKWRGVEISLVSTPADESVGVGRSRVSAFRTPDMSKQVSAPAVKTEIPMASETVTPTRTVAEERARVTTLHNLRARYDADHSKVSDEDFARFVNDESKGELEFRQFLESKNATPARVAPTATLEVKERSENPENYSLVRALRGLVFGNVEKQYTAEDARLRSLSPNCFKPAGARESALVTSSEAVRSNRYFTNSNGGVRAAQNAQGFAAGGALVGTTFAPDIIEYLRPVPVLQQAGAVVMSGITGGPGTIRFPKQAGDIYGNWAASGVASTAQTMPFGILDLSPKRLVAQVQIDKQLLLQESFDVEAYVRNSVNLQFALAYDLAGLIGNGNGMPLGILNTPGIQSGAVTFSGTASSPRFADFVSFRTKVLKANAGGLGKRSFISSPDSVQNWASVPVAATGSTVISGKFVLDDAEKVRGEQAYQTTYLNSLPTGYTNAGFTLPLADVVLYGPFGQYMFIEWAGVEWIYDPYTQASSDLVVLTARLYVDGGCRQPTAFVTSSNAGSVAYQ